MVRLPTKTEIEDLRALREPHSLTIYSPYIAPTSSSSDDPNRIQLKNLLKEAHLVLQTHKLEKSEINSILKEASKLLDSDEFRSSYKRGLVLFIRHNFFKYFHLPAEGFTPGVIVGKGFKLQPLLDLAANNFKYYVLFVSYNGAHLFKGDRYHVKKLKFQKQPTNMMQDLNIDELPKEKQLHQVAPADRGKGSARLHGQYNQTQVNKDLLVQFFRKINRRLQNVIKGKRAPLIIAGVDYLLPLYRTVNTYPHLHPEEIRGNLEHSSPDYIRESACKILTD